MKTHCDHVPFFFIGAVVYSCVGELNTRLKMIVVRHIVYMCLRQNQPKRYNMLINPT
jgi:hypothetical protein